jgi:hypothetical protein
MLLDLPVLHRPRLRGALATVVQMNLNGVTNVLHNEHKCYTSDTQMLCKWYTSVILVLYYIVTEC